MTDHRQVTVHRDGQAVQVDEGIADLIRALWAAGIDTEYSCQGGQSPDVGNELAYVAFVPEMLARFDAVIPGQPAHWERETGAISGFTAVRFPPSDVPWLLAALRAVPGARTPRHGVVPTGGACRR